MTISGVAPEAWRRAMRARRARSQLASAFRQNHACGKHRIPNRRRSLSLKFKRPKENRPLRSMVAMRSFTLR